MSIQKQKPDQNGRRGLNCVENGILEPNRLDRVAPRSGTNVALIYSHDYCFNLL